VESLSSRALIGALLLLIAVRGELAGAVPDKDLEGIKKKIDSEKKGLSQLQIREGGVLTSLGKIQDELEKKSRDLKIADAQYTSTIDAISRTEMEIDKLRGSITEREHLFRQRAVALYRWQRAGNSFWFDAVPSDLSATLQRKRYIEATLAFDQGLLADLRNQSQRQEALRRQLSGQRERLTAQKKVLLLARTAVAQEAEKKKNLLLNLRQERNSRLKVLREMESAAQRLQKMLEDIARGQVARPRQTPAPPGTSRGLDSMMGQMEWPVKGQVSAPFGKFKHPEFAAELVRKGIDINAALGENVRVVEKGRVVFADRFTGYGRMMIVDHGERYYTIYGHLSEIIRKIGDDVQRGDVIGRVGDSDSLSGAKLYFELRKDGRSVDPMPWFRK
jgi:septal ring factor EnvC (AmiA/AmiB activator)